MKLNKYLLGGIACASMALASCSDYLDINTNPNSPTDVNATYYQRLPFMQFYTNDATQFAAMRTGMGCGDWTSRSGTTYGNYSLWLMSTSPVTTAYQWWFCGSAANLNKAIETATAAGAYHYLGAFYLIKAYGFMLMTDLHGEMPYTEAISQTNIPKYDTGRTIFEGCLKDIDLAIENLQKTQEPMTESLSVGDSWAGGDTNKWIKFAYLLKARWLNHLSKKAAGKASDLKYDADEILACLDKSLQSNADNIIINHTDDNSTTHDVLGWDEPVDYSPLYSVIGMNSNYWVTKMLTDNFLNFDGKGIEDPRASKIIPWVFSVPDAASSTVLVKNQEPGSKKIEYLVKDSQNIIYVIKTHLEDQLVDGEKVEVEILDSSWRRSVGVDMSSQIHNNNGPYATSWYDVNLKGTKDDIADIDKKKKNPNVSGFYCDNISRAGDTIYVDQISSSKGYASNRSLFYYADLKTKVDRSAKSGSFMTRVSSPGFLSMYHEACFIRAEVLFKKGQTAQAFDAYKKGIEANIEVMRNKVNAWVAADANLADCPSFTPMEQSDIDNYINNAIGTAGDLTLAKIMTQKHMAMMFSMEQYNDMRRYDYAENVFMNWHIPAGHFTNATSMLQIPQGKFLRRWMQCSHETNYNVDNLIEIGDKVPGADNSDRRWYSKNDIWSIPVWWDSDQE